MGTLNAVLIGLALLFAWFGVPFVPAVGLTIRLSRRSYGRRGAAFRAALVGFGIALFFVGVAASTGFLNPRQGSDCGSDGCWDWPSKREVTEFIVGTTLGFWLLGIGVGAAVSYGLAVRRRRRGIVS